MRCSAAHHAGGFGKRDVSFRGTNRARAVPESRLVYPSHMRCKGTSARLTQATRPAHTGKGSDIVALPVAQTECPGRSGRRPDRPTACAKRAQHLPTPAVASGKPMIASRPSGLPMQPTGAQNGFSVHIRRGRAGPSLVPPQRGATCLTSQPGRPQAGPAPGVREARARPCSPPSRRTPPCTVNLRPSQRARQPMSRRQTPSGQSIASTIS